MAFVVTGRGDAAPLGDIDDAAVLARAQLGDADAFEEAVLRYEVRLRRYLTNLLQDQELAADVLQETFLELHQSLKRPDLPPSLSRWLYRVATNNAIDALRRRSVRTRVRSLFTATAPRPPDPTDVALDRLAATRALARLSAEDRACVLLHAALGLRYYEIGRMLGLSDDAARQRITRAKARFRRQYEREA
ncbi:MAG: RNA polymerase sigma factor [Dehalococcoidia bacterium]